MVVQWIMIEVDVDGLKQKSLEIGSQNIICKQQLQMIIFRNGIVLFLSVILSNIIKWTLHMSVKKLQHQYIIVITISVIFL